MVEISVACERCGEKETGQIHSRVHLDDAQRRQAEDILHQQHWNRKHLTCALCGEPLSINAMKLLYEDRSVDVHPNYAGTYDEQQTVGSRILYIHPECSPKLHQAPHPSTSPKDEYRFSAMTIRL